MAFIEERDRELGIIEDMMEKKEAVEVRIGHPFPFLPSSSSSSHHGQLTQHYFISSPAFDAGVGGDTSARSSGSGEAARPGEREHMFEKVVTPSDVGKLNRLVIPKQHAEKYFPLDSSATEKGLLLSFEDRSGKPWRFRYSYWNSSQSYVMTKGWSRFVKEKKLDAGDIVSFYRSCSGGRFFIDWRRRPDILTADASLRRLPVQFRFPVPWGRVFLPPQPAMQFNYGYYCIQPPPPTVFESVPVAHGKAPAVGKRVRLFGVNLEQCTSGEDSATRAINATTSNLLPLFCGGDDSTSNREDQLQRRKTRPPLSLDLDI